MRAWVLRARLMQTTLVFTTGFAITRTTLVWESRVSRVMRVLVMVVVVVVVSRAAHNEHYGSAKFPL
ncbi:hypothetical protein M0804_007593 [Polistes exclamans]|nr:hypothetical protein M0804_007593 [Polistes exclamans]